MHAIFLKTDNLSTEICGYISYSGEKFGLKQYKNVIIFDIDFLTKFICEIAKANRCVKTAGSSMHVNFF